jgi:hypothetical protein
MPRHAASSACHVGPDSCSAVTADLRVPWLFAAIVRLTVPADSEDARDVSEVRISGRGPVNRGRDVTDLVRRTGGGQLRRLLPLWLEMAPPAPNADRSRC